VPIRVRLNGSDEIVTIDSDWVPSWACAACGVQPDHADPQTRLARLGLVVGGGAEVVVCARCWPNYTPMPMP
jgi:hypothetical protein